MSAESWLRLYYPTKASDVQKKDALAHSLKKWRGLRPAVLARHGLHARCGTVYDGPKFGAEVLDISSVTCALCMHYFLVRGQVGCVTCPLFAVRGAPCDRDTDHDDSPYNEFISCGDPEPMIALIEKAFRLEKKKG